MLNHIRDILGDKAIVFSDSYHVDEERQLVAFEPNDLAEVIKDVIQTCADMCLNQADREAILELMK